MIREVLVLQPLAIDDHILIAEILVDGTVKDVANGIVITLVHRVIVPVSHEFSDPPIPEHCVNQRFDL